MRDPPSSSFAMEVEQTATAPVALQQQQTLTGRFCRCLFTSIFYLQLIVNLILVIFLTLKGLVITKPTNFHPKKWYTPLLATVALSGVLSLAWQCFFICNKRATIKATFWLTPILTLSVGVFLNLKDSPVTLAMCIILVIFSIAQAMYGFSLVSQRREFTFKMMSISTNVLPARTRAISVVSVILSVLYSGFLVAGIGGATATSTSLDILFISILVISLAWTSQVLKNVQLVAISKATYVYFARDEFMNAYDALGVTMKNQLGSVCIGSTLVPVYVLIRGAIRCGDGSAREMYASDRDCNGIANRLILCGNRWGFVYVGVYNRNFVQASSDTWRMFRRMDGLEELIDSDLTSSICFLNAIAIGAISALTAGTWAYLIHKDYFLQLTLYASIIGYFVARVASAWLQGCVMGYYVAYAENPQSDRFDNTIPQRIHRQNVEEAQRQRDNRVREDEDQEISYM